MDRWKWENGEIENLRHGWVGIVVDEKDFVMSAGKDVVNFSSSSIGPLLQMRWVYRRNSADVQEKFDGTLGEVNCLLGRGMVGGEWWFLCQKRSFYLLVWLYRGLESHYLEVEILHKYAKPNVYERMMLYIYSFLIGIYTVGIWQKVSSLYFFRAHLNINGLYLHHFASDTELHNSKLWKIRFLILCFAVTAKKCSFLLPVSWLFLIPLFFLLKIIIFPLSPHTQEKILPYPVVKQMRDYVPTKVESILFGVLKFLFYFCILN